MPVTYRENSSAVKWNLFVYYHPSPLYHYLAGVFNPWRREVSWRALLVLWRWRLGMPDRVTTIHPSYPPLPPSPRYLDVYFNRRRDAICHLFVPRFYNFLDENSRRFRESWLIIWNGLKLCNEATNGYLWNMYLWGNWSFPDILKREREENDDVKWDKGLV